MLLSKYEIIESIGRGQYGTVFRGFCHETQQIVAIKELSLDHLSTTAFLRELDILACLKHPNLLHLQALEYVPSGRYLVVDYCDAGTLRDCIESANPPSLITKLEFVIDVLEGLTYLHRHQVCHCDLKPDNILLTHEGDKTVACIGDFGSALTKDLVLEPSSQLQNLGSPAYMAPERFYGDCSYASDLYAVGIILYELITGHRPFQGAANKMVKAHFSQKIQLPKSLPFFLRSLISKALQKLPIHRFQTASEMLEACRLALEMLKASPEDWACVSE